MTAKLAWMPLYGRDLLADGKVRSLLLDDRMKWWYLVLLIHQWDEGAIPLDGNSCRGIVAPSMGTPAKLWAEFVALIPNFFEEIDEYLGQNKRLEEIRAEHVGMAERRTEKARIAGKASAQAKRKSNVESTQVELGCDLGATPGSTKRQLGSTNQIQIDKIGTNVPISSCAVAGKTDGKKGSPGPVRVGQEACVGVWEERLGRPSWARIGKMVKYLHEERNHPVDRITANFTRYIDAKIAASEGERASPEDFSRVFKLHGPQVNDRAKRNLQELV